MNDTPTNLTREELLKLCGGLEPHRWDWSREQLPEGWRPLLNNEAQEMGDEWLYGTAWEKVVIAGQMSRNYCCHRRTQRPLPSPDKWAREKASGEKKPFAKWQEEIAGLTEPATPPPNATAEKPRSAGEAAWNRFLEGKTPVAFDLLHDDGRARWEDIAKAAIAFAQRGAGTEANGYRPEEILSATRQDFLDWWNSKVDKEIRTTYNEARMWSAWKACAELKAQRGAGEVPGTLELCGVYNKAKFNSTAAPSALGIEAVRSAILASLAPVEGIGKPRNPGAKTSWVDCPVCGESDAEKETWDEHGEELSLIYCVNHACLSNGGEHQQSARAPKETPVEGKGGFQLAGELISDLQDCQIKLDEALEKLANHNKGEEIHEPINRPNDGESDQGSHSQSRVERTDAGDSQQADVPAGCAGTNSKGEEAPAMTAPTPKETPQGWPTLETLKQTFRACRGSIGVDAAIQAVSDLCLAAHKQDVKALEGKLSCKQTELDDANAGLRQYDRANKEMLQSNDRLREQLAKAESREKEMEGKLKEALEVKEKAELVATQQEYVTTTWQNAANSWETNCRKVEKERDSLKAQLEEEKRVHREVEEERRKVTQAVVKQRESLKAEVERLTKDLHDIAAGCHVCDKLKAEVERLKQETEDASEKVLQPTKYGEAMVAWKHRCIKAEEEVERLRGAGTKTDEILDQLRPLVDKLLSLP